MPPPRPQPSLALERTLGGDAWRLPSSARRLVAAHDDRHVRVVYEVNYTAVVALWDVETGRETTDGAFTAKRANDATSSHDGGVIALSHYGGDVTLWDARAGTLLRTITAPESGRLALDGRGRRLFAWHSSQDPGERGTFVYDVATGERLLRAPVPGHAALSLDGATLVGAVEHPRRVQSWELTEDGAFELHEVVTNGWAWAYVPLPDGDVIFGTSEGELRRWSPRDGATRWVREDFRVGIQELRATADGSRLALLLAHPHPRRDGVIVVLDGRTGETLANFPTEQPVALRLAREGPWLAALDFCALTVMDLPRGERRGHASGHTGPVTAVALTPDGRGVASAAHDGIRVWDVDAGDTRWTLEPPSEVESMVVMPDGGALVALVYENVVVAWDLATGNERTRESSGGRRTALNASPDARYALWATTRHGDDAEDEYVVTLWAWDAAQDKVVELADRPRADAWALAVGVTRDGREATVFTQAGPWRVDLQSFRRVARGRMPGQGRLIDADLDDDRAIGVWELDDDTWLVNAWDTNNGSTRGKPLRPKSPRLIPSRHGGPTVLAEHLGGQQHFELTDMRTREPVGTLDLRPYRDQVTCMTVSPDGRRIAVGTDRGLVMIFRRAES